MKLLPKYIPPDVQLVGRVLVQLSDEYEKNNKIIFQSESVRARLHFAAVNRNLKDWSTSKQCMVPGCGQSSIVRSHTIPKSMSLRVIEENGHVLVPSFDQKCGELKVKRVGVADATTFPGFCRRHEQLFEKFENKGSIDQKPEVYLQVYRAACKELFRARFVVEQHDWMIAEYCKTRDDAFVRLIRERATTLGLENKANLTSCKFDSDPLVEGANARVLSVRELITHMERRVLPALERAVFHDDESAIAVFATLVDAEIPVALAGSGSFLVAEDGAEKMVSLLMNVVPQSTGTLILMATLAEEERYLHAYHERWANNPLCMLSMIESWMINGTDQWCIRPSTWAKMPTARAAALLLEVVGSRRNVGHECYGSIFDDLRTELIDASEVANAGNRTPQYIQFIGGQRQKTIWPGEELSD